MTRAKAGRNGAWISVVTFWQNPLFAGACSLAPFGYLGLAFVHRCPEIGHRDLVHPDTISGHQRESLQKKELRKIHPIRRVLRTDIVSQMLFHIIDGCTNAGKALHRSILLFLAGSLYPPQWKSSCHFLLRSVLPLSFHNLARMKNGPGLMRTGARNPPKTIISSLLGSRFPSRIHPGSASHAG